LKPTLLSNSVHLLREAALEDGGIVCLPTLVAADVVLDGRLNLVLADHQLSAFWLSVFYPAQVRRTLKLKLFLELLATNFSGVPPWDAALISAGLLPERVID
jgi:DNA-binding transcriptional LysR family regulator